MLAISFTTPPFFLEANSLKGSGKVNNIEKVLSNLKDTRSFDVNIEFEVASSKIKGGGSLLLLESIIEQLKNHTVLRIEMIGHTDNRGSDSYNYKRSKQRAEAVKNHLTEQGIEAQRIENEGKGATQPKSRQLSENRRVEIIFIRD